MKYYFPLHFDGNNRGCEGIAKGTATILAADKNNMIAYCRDVPLDKSLNIDCYMTLQPYNSVTIGNKIKKSVENFITLGRKRTDLYFKYAYRKFLKQISNNDIMISTGGDMLCYGNNMVITTNNILHKRGIKTVLWGCSMGEENYTPEKHDTLKKFSLIYARESLTFEYFKSLGLKNIVCFPDPAFVLKPEACELPKCFLDSNVIGINLSPYVLKEYDISSLFGKGIKKLFDYIISNTNLHILLIPHVLWGDQDDRKVAAFIASQYRYNGRVSILESSKFNYLQIRYIISQCKYFIGGRTHAVISAYSTCVPTIALGYSIKSRGIAKDLGLDDTLVVDTREIDASDRLINSFHHLTQHDTEVKKILEKKMPEYSIKPFGITQYIKEL